mmetsp:Transcript_21892/g.67382  ORF Transcript_21892/g.67382 Transcript_21892/m.67382 type:complete len:649 (-) Transcript_21892:486-2432(-)
MRTASHDGICRVLHAFQTDQHVFIVLEYAERDLFHFLSGFPSGLPMQLAQYLNRIIALSIRHLHTRRIAHRDIKPENILVKGDISENNLIVKLCDFGLSLRPETKCADFVGSPGFFAPEILLEAVYDAFAADIWSYGALLIETVCGTPTFENVWLRAYRFLDRHDMFRDLIKGCVEKLPGLTALTRDQDLFRLVTGVLRFSPDRRDTIATVVMNPWLYLVTESPDDPGKLEILRLTIADDDFRSSASGPDVVGDKNGDAPAPQRRDALMSIAVDAKGASSSSSQKGRSQAGGLQPVVERGTNGSNGSQRPSRPSSASGGSKPSRARSMTMHMFRKPKKPPVTADEYTLPPMTICHLDDSAVVRQVVQAKLSMAFPNHRLVNFADSTHLIHTIMASQEAEMASKNTASSNGNKGGVGSVISATFGGGNRGHSHDDGAGGSGKDGTESNTAASGGGKNGNGNAGGAGYETIRICIFDENIGEDLKGSDLANMLKKLGYKGIVLCMTANEDLKVSDLPRAVFEGVISKQITTNKLKTQLLDAWKSRFGQSSLVPVIKEKPENDDENFVNLRCKCLEQMISHPKAKLKRVELLEMKGDLESVRSSEGLLEQVRDIINSSDAPDVSFAEDSPLFAAIKKELVSLDLTRTKARS